MRVGIYSRVSTRDKQNLDTQLLPLREHAARRGWTVTAEYVDRGESGTKDRRPQLDALMKAARSRAIDAVLVFKLDRFGRSLAHLTGTLKEFQGLGVEFVSLTEAIDSGTAAGKLMFNLLGSFAEFERELIVERVRAGLSRARKQGKTLGRPCRIYDREQVRKLRDEGRSIRQIASELGISAALVHGVLKNR